MNTNKKTITRKTRNGKRRQWKGSASDYHVFPLLQGVEITKRTDDKIHKIFLDPTGRHLIVCMKSFESYHLGRNNKKPKALQKFKVCWFLISFDTICANLLLYFLYKSIVCWAQNSTEGCPNFIKAIESYNCYNCIFFVLIFFCKECHVMIPLSISFTLMYFAIWCPSFMRAFSKNVKLNLCYLWDIGIR